MGKNRIDRRKSSIALLIVLVILLTSVGPILESLARTGFFKGMWSDVVDAIPFGSELAEIVVRGISMITSNAINTHEYLGNLQTNRGVAETMQEFCKLCLTSIAFTLVNKVGNIAMGLTSNEKGWGIFQKVIWNLFSAFFSAVISSLVLQFSFTQINQLVSGNLIRIWTDIITIIVLSGAVGICYFLFGITILQALGYVIVKLILMGMATLILSYLFLLICILAMAENALVVVIGSMTVWVGLIVMLIAIDMMLSSVFE